jgi:branched-chain amino acid transport system substrate-binding protein
MEVFIVKKTACLLVLSLLLLTVPASAADDAIKIGFLASLTGDGATWGQEQVKGAEIALEEINSAGGVLGRPLSLVVMDDRGRQEDAIVSARRLIDTEKVQIIGGANSSGMCIALSPVLEKARVPLLAPFASNPTATVDPRTNKVRPYTFRLCAIDPYHGSVMADYLYKKLDVDTAVILHDVGSEYSEGIKEYFTERFTKLGGKVLGAYGYRNGDVDFRAQLTQAKGTGAKALVMPSLYKEMGLMTKQAEELEWHPVLMGGDGFSMAMYEIAGSSMNDSYWTSNMDLDDKNVQELLAKYEKKYGKKVFEYTSVTMAYDIIYTIADAIKRAGKYDGSAIKDALENTKNLKLTHFTLTMDPETHNPLAKPLVIQQFRDGNIFYLDTWAASDLD